MNQRPGMFDSVGEALKYLGTLLLFTGVFGFIAFIIFNFLVAVE